MEELAVELLKEITDLCVRYHYFRENSLINDVKKITPRIQEFVSKLLDMIEQQADSQDKDDILEYTNGVINDYVSAIQNADVVLLIDTLDYGLRELLNMFADVVNENE